MSSYNNLGIYNKFNDVDLQSISAFNQQTSFSPKSPFLRKIYPVQNSLPLQNSLPFAQGSYETCGNPIPIQRQVYPITTKNYESYTQTDPYNIHFGVYNPQPAQIQPIQKNQQKTLPRQPDLNDEDFSSLNLMQNPAYKEDGEEECKIEKFSEEEIFFSNSIPFISDLPVDFAKEFNVEKSLNPLFDEDQFPDVPREPLNPFESQDIEEQQTSLFTESPENVEEKVKENQRKRKLASTANKVDEVSDIIQIQDPPSQSQEVQNLKKRRTKSDWSKENNDNLLLGVAIYGTKNWKKISDEYFSGKISGKQCREHYVNHLDPNLTKTKPWTKEEDIHLIDLQNIIEMRNKWSLMKPSFPGRSANDLKNHWNSTVKDKVTLDNNWTYESL